MFARGAPRNQAPIEAYMDHDPVNHPSHYTSHPSGVECIQVTRHMGFNVGNVIKYLWRAGLKGSDGGVEDLKKALFYLQDEIAMREKATAAVAPPSADHREWVGPAVTATGDPPAKDTYGGHPAEWNATPDWGCYKVPSGGFLASRLAGGPMPSTWQEMANGLTEDSAQRYADALNASRTAKGTVS